MLRWSLLFLMVLAFNDAQAKVKANCFITVYNQLDTSKTTKRVFPTVAESEQDCTDMGDAHRNNFNSKRIVKKEVSVEWKGSK